VTPARLLVVIRVTVGVIFLARTTPLLGWVGFRFAEPTLLGWPSSGFHVSFFSIPAWLAATLVVTRTVAALAFTVGFRARIFGVVAAIAGWALLADDALGYVNTIHLLYLATFFVALADVANMWLVRAVPLSVYAFSAIAKMNAEFASGRALLGFCEDTILRGPVARVACASPERAHVVSLLVIAGELALPVLLAIRPTRRVALACAIAFHFIIEWTMHPDVFGWLMVTLLLSFLRWSDVQPR
jgi:hypothetical protein